MKSAFITALFCLSAAGCATSTGDNSTAAEDKEYVTGSNIPRRDRSSVKTVDPAEIERMRSSIPAGGKIGN
jgi:hypothetical protein